MGEAQIARHNEAILRIEGTISDLVTRINQLSSQVEVMTASTTELVRTMAEMAVQSNCDRLQNEASHAQHRAEIEEIWRYLRYEPRNGNGRGEG